MSAKQPPSSQFPAQPAAAAETDAAVAVPHTELGAELLRAVVESFVLREGTDYGEHEISLGDKVNRVVRQLERGDAQILFDPITESIAIVPVGTTSRQR